MQTGEHQGHPDEIDEIKHRYNWERTRGTHRGDVKSQGGLFRWVRLKFAPSPEEAGRGRVSSKIKHKAIGSCRVPQTPHAAYFRAGSRVIFLRSLPARLCHTLPVSFRNNMELSATFLIEGSRFCLS